MARRSILERVPGAALAALQSRRRWSPGELAQVLGCRRETVYRLFPGGGQILTQQVVAAIQAAQERGRGSERGLPAACPSGSGECRLG